MGKGQFLQYVLRKQIAINKIMKLHSHYAPSEKSTQNGVDLKISPETTKLLKKVKLRGKYSP